jgi:hypothetical protein
VKTTARVDDESVHASDTRDGNDVVLSKVWRIDDERVEVWNAHDGDDDDLVVQMPSKVWRNLLMAAAWGFETHATSVTATLTRMAPSPSAAEISEIKESFDADAAAVLRLLSR